MSETFIGRQAIYDRNLCIHGYELLYRGSAESQAADHSDGDKATAEVILNGFLEQGAENLVGDGVCFINLTESFLTGRLPLPLPVDRVVIEVLEDVYPSPEIVEGVRTLRTQGVKIAMDDYIHREDNHDLLGLCDYVKIDLRAQDREATKELVRLLRPYSIKLLAEKVETMDEMRFCQDLGFDYFQGFFLTKPEVIRGKKLPANRIALLRMLSRLLDPNVEVEELEEMISHDISLAYRLLRFANSSAYAPSQPITAVAQTLMMLGLKAVKKIVSLIVLVDLDDRPGDLLGQSLVRAKMCEVLASRGGMADCTPYYTAGLLSTLDALTAMPMPDVLKTLPLGSDLEGALLGSEGDIGDALTCVRAFEEGDWSHSTYRDLDAMALTECYAEAVEYSREVWRSMPKEGSIRKTG
jgi:EAL and modified HD-GYP domain-containing signal transduction protein